MAAVKLFLPLILARPCFMVSQTANNVAFLETVNHSPLQSILFLRQTKRMSSSVLSQFVTEVKPASLYAPISGGRF